MSAISFVWTFLFSWLPLPLAIISAVLLVLSALVFVCRVLKFIWDALPFA